MNELRRRWPLVLGLIATFATLIAFGLAGPNAADWIEESSPLGIVGIGWAIALIALALGLGGQLLLNSRRLNQLLPKP